MTCKHLTLAATLLLGGLSACGQAPPVYHASDDPVRLSDWNLFEIDAGVLLPGEATLVFRPANQLFTDYAQKLRTLWIPEGQQAKLVDGELEYPVGTVISKTFYYPTDAAGNPQLAPETIVQTVNLASNRLLETRLLVRREAGWEAFPYVWNEAESEAFLRVAGSSQPLRLHTEGGNVGFTYFVPNENQCAGCHVTEHPDGGLHPLGAIAAQLAASLDYPATAGPSQLAAMRDRGWLIDGDYPPPPVAWRDETAGIEARARSYLDMNCGHCHNPEGAADTSNLILSGGHGQLLAMGLCKPPVAAGGGAGDLLYGIVPGEPDESILLYRMQSQAPDEMMPELGRALVHREGVGLVSRWVEQMPGRCD